MSFASVMKRDELELKAVVAVVAVYIVAAATLLGTML